MKRIALLLLTLSCAATSGPTTPPAPATPHQCMDACLPDGVHIDVPCYEACVAPLP